MLREISTAQAPVPVGPYSQAIVAGGFLFTAGQGPIDPRTGAVVGSTIEDQTQQTITNLERILAAAGAGLADVARVTVHLADLSDFARFNEIYGARFRPPRPARTTVGSALMGILVEIDVIAVLDHEGR